MPQVGDALHLERLSEADLHELLRLSIEEGSRSVLGIGPIWEALRARESLGAAASRLFEPLLFAPAWVWAPALAVVGAGLASFADQKGWRLARLEEAEDLGVALSAGDEKVLHSRRSRCPACLAPVSPRDLVPVLSWIRLRGRARCCGVALPRRHLVVELAGAALLPLLLLAFGPGWAFFGAALYAVVAGAAALADIERHVLPDRLNYALLWIALGAALVAPSSYGPDPLNAGLHAPFSVPLPAAVAGVAAAWIFLWLFNKALSLIYKRDDALGWGDVKLLAALGAWLGPTGLVLATLLGSASAVAFAAAARKREFPAGPHLALGGLLAMLPAVQGLADGLSAHLLLTLQSRAAP